MLISIEIQLLCHNLRINVHVQGTLVLYQLPINKHSSIITAIYLIRVFKFLIKMP